MANEAVFLAMDLGTGKTATVITVLNEIRTPAMVFAPVRAAFSTWPDELERWNYYGTYSVVHNDWKRGKEEAILANSELYIMPYSSLKWFYDALPKLVRRGYRWTPRTLILDESSMVKSSKTARFRMMRKMDILWNKYRMLLSATPSPNSLTELWPQYYLMDRGKSLGPTLGEFRDTYCAPFTYPGKSFVTYNVRPTKVDDLHAAVAPSTYHISAADHLSMPAITYNQITTELGPRLARRYKELEDTFFLELEEAEGSAEAVNAGVLANKLRQFVQGGIYYYPENKPETMEHRQWEQLHVIKLKALKELVETSVGQPILCAIQFKFELDMILKVFPDAPVIAGGTSAKQAQTYISNWNAGVIPLMFCHPASLGHGVNLQSGGHILLWYGLTWSLELYLQLNGRLYRQGQEWPVVIHHFIMRNTIDEAVMRALENKARGQNALLSYIKGYHEQYN